jgi:hypothetical protein
MGIGDWGIGNRDWGIGNREWGTGETLLIDGINSCSCGMGVSPVACIAGADKKNINPKSGHLKSQISDLGL